MKLALPSKRINVSQKSNKPETVTKALHDFIEIVNRRRKNKNKNCQIFSSKSLSLTTGSNKTVCMACKSWMFHQINKAITKYLQRASANISCGIYDNILV